jgi:hypothetical protein
MSQGLPKSGLERETAMRSLSKGQRDKVERALEQHLSFSGSYFWTPPTNASGRRSMERKNNWSVGFTHEGVRYSYGSSVRCSAGNVYYRGFFRVNGERATVRKFKALV